MSELDQLDEGMIGLAILDALDIEGPDLIYEQLIRLSGTEEAAAKEVIERLLQEGFVLEDPPPASIEPSTATLWTFSAGKMGLRRWSSRVGSMEASRAIFSSCHAVSIELGLIPYWFTFTVRKAPVRIPLLEGQIGRRPFPLSAAERASS